MICFFGGFFFGKWVLSGGNVYGTSLLQEGEAEYTCMLCWAGYLFLDYKKGARPQPYSCPQVASSEACLTALDPCSHIA